MTPLSWKHFKQWPFKDEAAMFPSSALIRRLAWTLHSLGPIFSPGGIFLLWCPFVMFSSFTVNGSSCLMTLNTSCSCASDPLVALISYQRKKICPMILKTRRVEDRPKIKTCQQDWFLNYLLSSAGDLGPITVLYRDAENSAWVSQSSPPRYGRRSSAELFSH